MLLIKHSLAFACAVNMYDGSSEEVWNKSKRTNYVFIQLLIANISLVYAMLVKYELVEGTVFTLL